MTVRSTFSVRISFLSSLSSSLYSACCPSHRGAHIDVRNKKGNTPLWLAANGGHFDVVQLLVQAGTDVDAADNRKITPLMAAFRKVVHTHTHTHARMK